MSERVPLWRIPALWLVIVLPAIAIAGGIGMVVVSTRVGGIDSVPDAVRRTAQVQTADLGPDAQARERGLSAVVRSQDGIVEVLPATGEFERKAPLVLHARHPTRAAEDRTLELAATATGWRARATLDDGHDWNLELTDGGRRWRLVGRLARGEYAARVAPALDGDSP